MRILLSDDEIRGGVERISAEIRRDYAGLPLSIVGVLTGSLVFVADLIRRIDLPLRVGLVQAHSYRGAATRPSELTVSLDLLPDIKGRHVLLVDDIFDTGHTLARLLAEVARHEPASVRSAVLLKKRERQEVEINPDYVAFEIPNEFVIGYGLDYRDAHRNLPYVAVIEPDDLGGEPGK